MTSSSPAPGSTTLRGTPVAAPLHPLDPIARPRESFPVTTARPTTRPERRWRRSGRPASPCRAPSTGRSARQGRPVPPCGHVRSIRPVQPGRTPARVRKMGIRRGDAPRKADPENPHPGSDGTPRRPAPGSDGRAE